MECARKQVQKLLSSPATDRPDPLTELHEREGVQRSKAGTAPDTGAASMECQKMSQSAQDDCSEIDSRQLK